MGDVEKTVRKAGKEVSKGYKKATKGLSTRGISREIKKASKDITTQGSLWATGGAYSTDGKSGYAQGNTFGAAVGKAMGVDQGKKVLGGVQDAMSGRRKDVPNPDAEGDLQVNDAPDPYLEEELENARRRSRASTILGGASDTGGSGSAKRTLLGI